MSTPASSNACFWVSKTLAVPLKWQCQMYNPDPLAAQFNPRRISLNPPIIRLRRDSISAPQIHNSRPGRRLETASISAHRPNVSRYVGSDMQPRETDRKSPQFAPASAHPDDHAATEVADSFGARKNPR